MASTHLSSGERLRIYQAIFRINQHFHLIVARLMELRDVRYPFGSRKLAELRSLTQEMQAEINQYVTGKMRDIEVEDWQKFGKVRSRKSSK